MIRTCPALVGLMLVAFSVAFVSPPSASAGDCETTTACEAKAESDDNYPQHENVNITPNTGRQNGACDCTVAQQCIADQVNKCKAYYHIVLQIPAGKCGITSESDTCQTGGGGNSLIVDSNITGCGATKTYSFWFCDCETSRTGGTICKNCGEPVAKVTVSCSDNVCPEHSCL